MRTRSKIHRKTFKSKFVYIISWYIRISELAITTRYIGGYHHYRLKAGFQRYPVTKNSVQSRHLGNFPFFKIFLSCSQKETGSSHRLSLKTWNLALRVHARAPSSFGRPSHALLNMLLSEILLGRLDGYFKSESDRPQ